MPPTVTASPAATQQQALNHYENFPVASWLCPPRLRPVVTALYHFARTADDLADEGEASPQERLNDLEAYRVELEICLSASGQTTAAPSSHPASRWPQVFGPLGRMAHRHQLPAPLLHQLLDAFEQDVRYTASGHRYADHSELLAYCQLSANPVGRLLLHLYGVTDADSLRMSDQICSALQLINFWQDISVDLPRQRYYLPTDTLQGHGLGLDDFVAALAPASVSAGTRLHLNQTVENLCREARALMLAGAPLARRLPGRAGWELRLVVQGGLRILDKIATQKFESWHTRPRLSAWDAPLLLWRALMLK